MGIKTKAGVVVVLIAANTYLVSHYAQGQFPLPAWLDRFMLEAQQKLSQGIDEISARVSTGDRPLPPPENIEALPAVEELTVLHPACLDKRMATPTKRIYTWKDSQGIQHISDKPRRIDDGTPVELVTELPPEAISVNFLGLQGSYALKQSIINQVKASRKLYAQVVPAPLIKPITVNLRLFTSQSGYARYRDQASNQLKNTQGFYRSGTNESVVWVQSDVQGEKTAVHEAMHGINRHWIGQMAKWLNEGVAELAENIQAGHRRNRSRFKGESLLPLHRLLNATPGDWTTRTSVHYLTANALVSYLYFTERTTLTRLLLAEAENGCETLTQQEVERITGYAVHQLDTALKHWIK